MPRRSESYLTPAAWLAEDGTWPDGPYRSGTPHAVGYAVFWSVALGDALREVNRTELCARISIKRDTLYEILNGRTWADTITLVKLEVALDARLWPQEVPEIRVAEH